MRTASRTIGVFGALALSGACLAFVGCDHIHGRPGPGPEVVRPDEVLAFPTLYKQNCAACHGEDGKNGAAISLANPVYLALAGEETMQHAIEKGVPGKLMPAFAKSSGGMLTDRQVSVIAHGLVQQWGTPDILAGQNPPPYLATLTGNAARGQQAFSTFCARCHGATGEGAKGEGNSGDAKTASVGVGSIVETSYLALISDQSLRSITIAGRPDEGMPDWRGDASQPLTDQQTTDIVAWLASKRSADPGQPYKTQP